MASLGYREFMIISSEEMNHACLEGTEALYEKPAFKNNVEHRKEGVDDGHTAVLFLLLEAVSLPIAQVSACCLKNTIL